MRVLARGVSPIIGLVLLIGLVGITSMALLVVSGGLVSDAKQQAEHERAEQSFVELSQTISSIRANGDAPRMTSLDAGERGALAREETGSYTITVDNGTGEKSIGNGTIGTIEYESSDGTTIAYEAGAVFRETGAETQVISEPPFDYERSTNTLILPITTVTESKELSSGDLAITQKGAARATTDHVRNYRVYLDIESEYCRGWQRYFTDQTGHTSIEERCSKGDQDAVKIRLGYDDLEDAFSDGVSLPNGEDSIGGKDQHNPFGDVAASDFPPLDETIELLVESAEDDEFEEISGSPVTEDKTLDGGKYYAEGIGSGGSLSFNLSDDDAILVVNGSVSTHNDDDGITVSDCGDGNQLRVYVTGDLDMDNGGTIGPDCGGDGDVTTIQVYGTSEMGVNFGQGNPTFEGLLYAASGGEVDGWDGSNSDEQVFFQGSPYFNGSLIAESVHIDSQVNSVSSVGLDGETVEAIPSGYEPAPQITYLNVVHYEVDVRNR